MIYRKYSDAVVQIYSYHENKTVHGQGSGVIIKSLGWVITNHHVLGDGVELNASHNGKFLVMDSVVAMEPVMDILILHFSEKDERNKGMNIPSLELSGKKDLKIGQRIYAIGSPYGFENTITEGLVSGLRRGTDTSREFIQISAPISQGSSGGAIIDSKGRLVGITTMVMTGQTAQNLNFAIPVYEIVKLARKKSVLEMTPKEAVNYYYSSGNNDYLSGKYPSAIYHYKKAITYGKEEDLPSIYFNLGVVYRKVRRDDSALFFFEQALKMVSSPQDYVKLGYAFSEYGYNNFALASYQRALSFDSTAIEPLMGAATASYSLKLYSESLDYVEKILRYDKFNAEAWYMAGNIMVLVGKDKSALGYYKIATDIKPKFALAWIAQATIYQRTGDSEKEIECRQKAYLLDPSLRDKKKE